MILKKGILDRTWQEIKEALEYFDAEAIVKFCINRDRNNIKRYDELLERKELPDNILELLGKTKISIGVVYKASRPAT